VKRRVSELEGAELDYAVAVALGWESWIFSEGCTPHCAVHGKHWNHFPPLDDPYFEFSPSRTWSDGGPIIEMERIWLTILDVDCGQWFAQLGKEAANGRNPLIAAMRAFVASKFGDEVEIQEIKP
jgi:hypothetical protein